MATVAVVGAGAVGGVVAACLLRSSKNAVTVATRTPFDYLQITYGDSTSRFRARVLTRPAEPDPHDWVLVATKAYDAGGAAEWFPTLVGPNSVVAILQNGVEHRDRFAPYVPSHQILPVVVNLPAERSAPGVVTRKAPGRLTVEEGATAAAFAELFAGSGIAIERVEDLKTAAWRKLCLNVTGAVSALSLTEDIPGNDPDVAGLLRAVVAETVRVGNAAGADLDVRLVDEIVGRFQGAQRHGISSMLADRLAGRLMETDARNGAVVRIGKELDIPTPINQALVGLLKSVDARAHSGLRRAE